MKPQNKKNIDDYLDRIAARFLESKKRQWAISQKAKSDPDVIDMGSAASMNLFEDMYSSENFSMSGKEIVDLVTKYPPIIQTDFRLEESIIDFIARRIGIKFGTENVVVFRGAYGSYIPIFSFFVEKDLIIPENIHQIHKAHFAANGFVLHEVPSDTGGLLDVRAVESTLRKNKNTRWIYINHNRGAAPTKNYLNSLARLLKNHDAYALYDADVLFTCHVSNAKPWLPLVTPAFLERAIVVSNLTKEFGVPGLRIGFGIGHKTIVTKVRHYQKITLEMIPPITKYLAKKIIDKDDISKAVLILRKRMEVVKSGFVKLGWPAFQGPDSGVNLFLQVPPEFQKAKKYDPDELFCYHLVQKSKILLRPASTYGNKKKNEVRAVICQPLQVIDKLFSRLKKNGVYFGMGLPNGLEDDYGRAISSAGDHMGSEDSPARLYHSLVGFSKPKEILNFGIKKTPLVNAPHIARWLGVKKCLLKLETTHPTGTVKDRSTEIVFSFFKKNKLDRYVHTSTGNTATSLVWGLGQYRDPFSLILIIPGQQLRHHNFRKVHGLNTILLEGASYDEARKYCEWYVKNKRLQNLFLDFKKYRPTTYQIPYLEAFEEIRTENLPEPGFVFQTISGGSGILGAYIAATNAVKKGWLTRIPKISIVQPDRADVITKCFNAGLKTYHDRYTQKVLRRSKAFAIRRGDAAGCYEKVREVLVKTKGIAQSVSEKEIENARKKLYGLEGIKAGYTACVALAGIRKEARQNSELRNNSVLVMITGLDRSTKIQPKIDKVIPKKKWQRVVNR